MKDHNHKRLDAAIERRDRADRTAQQLQGRLAAAQEAVAGVEAECKERGIAPANLDAAIKQLERRYDNAVSVFEKDISEAEGAIAPFM